MHISAVEEYGLRCVLQLAQQEPRLAASQIAEREGISVQYASKIMHLLKKAGLVEAVRGTQGGFCLSRPANAISVKEVFSAFREDSQRQDDFCGNYKGQLNHCTHLHDCTVRPVWHVLSSYFDSVLKELTLEDLSKSEKESEERLKIFAQKEADRIREKFKGAANATVGDFQ
ncbi:MAG: Rrf2 family transcriptional regulator [Oligoflexia bacterium]|nr:Rrf2 family transcriptional regulator [Oligoflexia bacterium]